MDAKQRKVTKGVVSGAISFLIAEISKNKINKMRKEAGLPHIHHYQLGISGLSIGALNSEKEFAPYAIGGGTGLIISDIMDVVKDVKKAYRPLPHPFSKYELEGDDVEVHNYKISDTNLKRRYNKIADILKHWTLKQASDPVVMAWARSIVQKDDTLEDARDPIKCGRALAYWINGYPNNKRGIKYVKDPRKRSFDSFQSATRTLKWKTGDCDCLSLLWGTGMHSLGHSNGYYLLSQNPLRPQQYGHILPTIISSKGEWIPCELTRCEPIGYEPYHFKRGKIFVD